MSNHRRRETALVWTLAIVLLAVSPAALTDDAGHMWTSKAGLYRVGYKSELEPIEINKIHNWVLHVETAAGSPVLDAMITISGGMPAHNHGLPTEPRVTKNMGHGDYLVEGMRFHMAGAWVITVAISAAAGQDTCTIPLEL
jgi:hypothetical protein